MSNKSIMDTMAEVKHICDVTKSDIDMIQVDTEAFKPQKFDKKTTIFERKASGGTILSPAIEMAKQHNIDYQCIVVITDGYISEQDISAFEATRKRVVWLIERDGTINEKMKSGRMKAFKLD